MKKTLILSCLFASLFATASADGKFVENKQLFIRKNGTKYDVSGRRMK